MSIFSVPFLHFWFPPSGNGTIHFINIVAIAGVIASGMGFYYTYRQLQISNDRIDSYEKLYYWVHQLLEEIKSTRNKRFYFFGSTIIPGNISRETEKITDNYDTVLFQLGNGYNDYEGTSIKLILPDDNQLKDNYNWFKDKLLLNSPEFKIMTDEEWKKHVDEKCKKAQDAQNKMKRFSSNLADAEKYAIIKHAYFWSNGKRVIYVTPLHYVDDKKAPTKEKRHKIRKIRIEPQLYGFTTKNPSAVRGYENFFDLLMKQKETP
jgi:hypothetical protein